MLPSLRDELHIYRKRDNKIYEGEVTERTIDRNPYEEAILSLELSTSQTGTLYLNGNNTETITFTSSKYARSVNTYTSLAGITPSSLTDDITIRAVNRQNEPVMATKFINTIKCHFPDDTSEQYFTRLGLERREGKCIFARWFEDIEVRDLVKINDKDSDDFYEVKEIFTPRLNGKIHHKELVLITHNT